MIEVSINVPEIREFIKEIIEVPGRIFEILRFNVRETVGRYLSLLMESELTFMLGRERYDQCYPEASSMRMRSGMIFP